MCKNGITWAGDLLLLAHASHLRRLHFDDDVKAITATQRWQAVLFCTTSASHCQGIGDHSACFSYFVGRAVVNLPNYFRVHLVTPIIGGFALVCCGGDERVSGTLLC
jgi:hypothetical protein